MSIISTAPEAELELESEAGKVVSVMERRRQHLENSVYLLAPTLGSWRGVYQLPRQTTATIVDGATVDRDDITSPCAKLMTDTYPLDQNGKSWKKRFAELHKKLESAKNKFSIGFSIPGVRIIPKKKVMQFLRELYGETVGDIRKQVARAEAASEYVTSHKLRTRLSNALLTDAPDVTPLPDPDGDHSLSYLLYTARSEFVASWDNVLEQIRSKNSVYAQVANKVPKKEDLASKFYLDVVPIEISGKGGNERDMDDFLSDQAVIRDACRRRVEEAIEDIIEGPRQQLADAIANLEGVIARDGRLTDKSFRPIQAAIEKLRLFDFAADSAMLERIATFEKRLQGVRPNTLTSRTAASNGFSAALQGVYALVTDAEKQSSDVDNFGMASRPILE